MKTSDKVIEYLLKEIDSKNDHISGLIGNELIIEKHVDESEETLIDQGKVELENKIKELEESQAMLMKVNQEIALENSRLSKGEDTGNYSYEVSDLLADIDAFMSSELEYESCPIRYEEFINRIDNVLKNEESEMFKQVKKICSQDKFEIWSKRDYCLFDNLNLIDYHLIENILFEETKTCIVVTIEEIKKEHVDTLILMQKKEIDIEKSLDMTFGKVEKI